MKKTQSYLKVCNTAIPPIHVGALFQLTSCGLALCTRIKAHFHTSTKMSTSSNKECGMAFLDACESGDILQVWGIIARGLLSPYSRNEGLRLAVAQGIHPDYIDIVAALQAAGATITHRLRDALHGDDMEQDPAVIRLLFQYGLDPNATQSADFEPADSQVQTGGEPLLKYV